MNESARDELISILVDAHRSDDEPLPRYGHRVHDELVARPGLLVRLLGVPRPGPCGHQPPVLSLARPVCCTLDAGHAGCHKDEHAGTIWREVE